MNKQDLKLIDFYESRERFAMNQLFNQHIKPQFADEFDVSLYLTSTYAEKVSKKATCYDALMYFRNKITNAIEYKFIIEVKYRDADYESMLLEKVKYKALIKQYDTAMKNRAGKEDIMVLYINFTPTGTFIFNLTRDKITEYVKDKKNKIKEKHVKTTYVTNDKKVNKQIYYLHKSLAKRFDLNIYKDFQVIQEVAKAPVKIVNTIKTYSLF